MRARRLSARRMAFIAARISVLRDRPPGEAGGPACLRIIGGEAGENSLHNRSGQALGAFGKRGTVILAPHMEGCGAPVQPPPAPKRIA